MKRVICVLLLTLLIVSYTWSDQPRRFYNPESVMAVWEKAIRSRNLDAFAGCYWEDAAQWWLLPDGRMEHREGIGAIIRFQARIFEEVGQEIVHFRLPEPDIQGKSYTGLPMFIYDNNGLGTTEVFWYGERAGRIRIERQLVIPRYFEDVEVGEMQAWADENRDGILQPHEQELVYDALWKVTHEPHRVSNPLDEFCDWNRNDRIDEAEMILARSVLIRDSLRRGFIHFPDFTRQYLDQNRSGSIDLCEAEEAFEMAYGEGGDRPVESPLGEKIDFILDGVVTEFERQIFTRNVTRLVATIHEWPVFERLAEGSTDWVITWADANDDGVIGEEELWDVGRLMRGALAETEIITSPIGLHYDEDHDLRLSPPEREKAANELLNNILPEVMQIDTMSFERAATISELDVNENGWLDPREVESFGKIALNPERLIGRSARTPLERRIDREPRDGKIDEWEVFSFTEGVFATIAEIWLLQSGKIGQTAVGLSSAEPFVSKVEYETAVDLKEKPGKEIDEVPKETGEKAAGTEVSKTRSAGSLSAAVTLYPVFPVLFKYHDKAPVGKVVIRNGMSVQAKNLQVKLSMQRYIDSPRVSAQIDSLAAGQETTVDLLALFNEDVLDLTEGTRTAAQVIIDYDDSTGRKQLAVTETMTLYDRNAIQWDDDEKVASFVTARDPQIRLLATNMTALIRRYKNTSISDNLQNAMVLYSAMIQHNLGYNIDPNSSYKMLSRDSLAIDYVQFPRQTLIFKGGDCDDLSVCYASLLEAIGIPSAFITVPGHIYVALGLKMDASTAKARFSKPEDLIFAGDGTVWVPVEITKLNDSNPDFLDAWSEGAKEWREHNSRDQAQLIPTSSAWQTYEPVAASFMTDSVALPDTKEVLEAFRSDLARFVNLEIADQELTLQGRLSSDPNSPRLLNLLGTLYARYGLSEKSREKFTAAVAGQEYFGALMNLGHLEFLAEEYLNANAYYQRALKAQPDNTHAILALARTDHELENYGNVRSYYAQLEQLSPQLARDYGYLDLRASESVRAEESTRLRKFIVWEIEESE
jgi:tetratricopeptide (TPR) repeat protein